MRIFLLFAVILFGAGVSNVSAKEPYTNRLIKEKSPYLLQHAHNPVDWYPWNEEAFKKAKKENKPIFLSIGYSTCHWCHVMEEESFSNLELAEILNQHFVSIKVDREERPDIDNLYMQVVIALTGNGGWPLTVFLTPNKKPFYGGTYFAPDDRWGRPGLKTTLLSIAKFWREKEQDLINSSEKIINAISQKQELKVGEPITLDEQIFKKAFEIFDSSYDSEYGGFGQVPKFSSGHSLSFLLRYWQRIKDIKALQMVENTLIKMAEGGIYDHIGGGFHRYSTDREWRVPHFEKMLYDQAILSKAYLEAYQVTKQEEYAKKAKEILDYVLRDMTQPEGSFYSAEDADSSVPENPKEKKEGAFYLWAKDEVLKILGSDKGEIFSYYFDIKPEGNIISDPYREFSASGGKGKNILYIVHSIEETAEYFKKSPEEIEIIIKEGKVKLFKERSKRPRPHLDDKILVDWNGLMISSLSFGYRVLNEERYLYAAEKATQFILKKLIRKDGRLLHRYRQDESAILGSIDDYAFFIQGLLDLYEASFNPDYLIEAKRLTQEMLRLLWDDAGAGFFFTSTDAEKLFYRQKEIYDGAVPSGNSIAILDLIRLARLTMEKEFEIKVDTMFKAFSNKISSSPQGSTQMLIALDFTLGPSREIVIAGEKKSETTKELLDVIFQRFIPNKVVAFRPAEESEAKAIISLVPFLKEQLPLEGKTTVYVCENYICKFPVTDKEKLIKLLQ
jgi:uncharacterized protein YyaL (SSP411 family)